MKTISSCLRAFVLTSMLAGCDKSSVPPNKDGFPVIPRIGYDIVRKATSTSWFSGDNPVTSDSVLFQATPPSGGPYLYRPEVLTVRGRLCFRETVGPFLAEIQPPNSPVYVNNRLIRLGKQDVDTLHIEATPAVFSSFEKIEQLRYYYNGRLSASYDFRANPDLLDSLLHAKDFTLVVPLRKFSGR